MSGLVACGRIQRGHNWPEKDGFERINVCSSAQGWSKAFSPFVLGPIEVPTGTGTKRLIARKFENLWQQSKVYPSEVGQNGEPTDAFFARRNKAWDSSQGMRYVKIKGKSMKGQRFEYIWWQGKHLSYLEGRREIYMRYYVKEVQKTGAWEKLKKMHDSGENLLIVGFDGRDFGDSLEQAFKDETKPFGHELVLCGMLTGAIDLKTGDFFRSRLTKSS